MDRCLESRDLVPNLAYKQPGVQGSNTFDFCRTSIVFGRPVKEHLDAVFINRFGIEEKFAMLLQERGRSTTLNKAFGFVIRAVLENTKPSHVEISPLIEHKDIQLVMRNTGQTFSISGQVADCLSSRSPQRIQIRKLSSPDGKVHIFTLMPNFDSGPAELPESWHLFP